ncbi:MAG: Clp protease ClpP, partial [Thermoguttaceae bacterium]|nr:Clp protease ClpP [Thermoguttaceae bacterium]
MEILLYDRIEAAAAKLVRDRLAAAGRGPVDVRIHSPGGSLFAGMAIYSALQAHPGRVIVHIDGMAASIASVIAMAGDERVIAENAYFMIHDPAMTVEGSAADLRTAADLVDRTREQIIDVYARRTKADRETLTRL